MAETLRPILEYGSERRRQFPWRAIARRVMMIALVVAPGPLAYILQPRSYTAVGFLTHERISPARDQSESETAQINSDREAMFAWIKSPHTLRSMLRVPMVSADVWSETEIAARIRIRAIPNSKLIEVTCVSPSAERADDAVDAITTAASSKTQYGQWRYVRALVAPNRLNPIWFFGGATFGLLAILVIRMQKKGSP